MMTAQRLDRPGPIDGGPLQVVDIGIEPPAPDEVEIAVAACGVCRTDLQIVEGDIAARRLPIVPGHQVVGRVVAVGTPPQISRAKSSHTGAYLRRLLRESRKGKKGNCVSPVAPAISAPSLSKVFWAGGTTSPSWTTCPRDTEKRYRRGVDSLKETFATARRWRSR